MSLIKINPTQEQINRRVTINWALIEIEHEEWLTQNLTLKFNLATTDLEAISLIKIAEKFGLYDLAETMQEDLNNGKQGIDYEDKSI
jgi:hypothetical protein